MDDYQALVRRLVKSGWTLDVGRKHNKVHHPCGRSLVVLKSSSDRNAVRALAAAIKKIETGRPS